MHLLIGNAVSRIALLAGMVVCLVACSTLTPEEEIQLGDQIINDINSSVSLFTDQEMEAYIDDLSQQLIAVAPTTRFEFSIRLIDSEGFNAFAFPGGNIYLTTGVIKASRNVAELASILSHEIAHVVLDHVSTSYRRNNVTQVATDIISITIAIATGNPFIMGAGELATNLGSTVYVTSHSRSSEREADEMAFQMMLDAGYDPRSQLTIFSRLQIAMQEADEQIRLPFLVTHPLPAERIEEVRNRLAKMPPGQRLVVNDGGRLDAIRNRLWSE